TPPHPTPDQASGRHSLIDATRSRAETSRSRRVAGRPHPGESPMTQLKTQDVDVAAADIPAGAAVGEIRPFHVRVPDRDLADLEQRRASTRWPTPELVSDRSQGVQLETLREIVRFWSAEHDWRQAEAKLNALPQFVTRIDGVDIHFIHVRSPHEDALPMIVTHGWPGSVIEMLGVVGPLTDPTAHGGTPDDAFHLVLPSLPGYGFSSEPTELGWHSGRIAAAWAELMDRLGYSR